jgi:hypothetical protein
MTWMKWKIATIVYVIFLLLYVVIACSYFGWSAEMLVYIGGVVFSIVPAYIILFWSLDEARKGTNEQIETLRKLTSDQINALRESTQLQIDSARKGTNEQIEALQKLTSDQINALRDSTQRQIDSFSVQCQGIVSAVEQVVGAIAKMSEDNRKRMEQEEKRLETLQKLNEDNLRAKEREIQKTFEEKQRIAPRVFVRIADEMWWFFFRHYQLHVYNSGGLLNNMELTYFFSNVTFKTVEQRRFIGSLNREQGSGAIDCGDVSTFSAYTAIQISVFLRDKEERLYVGSVRIDKSDSNWKQIPLGERAGE